MMEIFQNVARTHEIHIELFFRFQIIDYTQRDAAGLYECFVEETYGTYPLVTAELIVVG